MKKNTGLSASSEFVFSVDEKLRWQDHHCMDAGVEYDMKHADLEKSFGVNIPIAGVKFWSRIIPGPLKRKRRKVNGKDMFAAGIEAKKRLLEQSASAAHAYFMDPSLVDTMDDNRIGELDTEVNSQDHKLDDADPHFVAEFEKYEENNKSKSLLEGNSETAIVIFLNI